VTEQTRLLELASLPQRPQQHALGSFGESRGETFSFSDLSFSDMLFLVFKLPNVAISSLDI